MEAESTKNIYSIAGIGDNDAREAEDYGLAHPTLLDPTSLNGIGLICEHAGYN